MRFRLLVVGKLRAGSLADCIREFEKRAARYWPLEVMELPDQRSRARTPALIQRGEGLRILSALKGGTLLVCDERGTGLTSYVFARRLQSFQEGAHDVDIVIGGAYGLADVVRERATILLALAPWTLSHELARLVLLEQLYRAGTIVRGEPYHK
jgi:23S rRNA (pseudouridine1915-N3)-methyltransferase